MRSPCRHFNGVGRRGTSRVLVLALAVLASSARAQWTTQSPLPTHLDVRGVGAPGPQRVFIATDDNSFDNGGALFESQDGGSSWVQRPVPAGLGSPLNGLFFLDTLHGWTFGNENYRTTDGGTTWTALPFLGSTYFMEFSTPSVGLASGNFPPVMSRDGGDTWNASPHGIFALDFMDTLTGLGASDSALYRTTDGGISFTAVASGSSRAAVFLSSDVAVGILNDMLVRSTDGGATWTAGPSAAGKSRLQVISSDVVLAWGRTGSFPTFDERILRSTDGGQSWSDLGEVIPEGVLGFGLPDAQTVVAADPSGNMHRSTDAGWHWSQVYASPGPRPGFLSSAVPVIAGGTTGYFGYGAGFVIKTTDAGASWFQISSGSGRSLLDVDRFPDGRMIAVGESGTLLTSAGTPPWVLSPALTQNDLRAVKVVGATEVVAVDGTGQVYRSTDAGATWAATAGRPTTLSPAEDVHFTTLLDGWVLGQSLNTAAVYHTTDGGDTWTPSPGFLGAYVALDVKGENLWAANVTGRYYRSTDNGATWIEGDLPGSVHQIRDMEFVDAFTGYAAGWWGEAFRTDNGGATWTLLPTPVPTHNFTDIHLIGPNELWLSTAGGPALYSATAGQNWAVIDIMPAGFGGFTAITASAAGSAWTVGFQGAIEYFAGPPPPPLNRPPEASFGFVAAGLTVSFTDSSSDPDGTVIGWHWDFGDSTTSTERHPTHTYATANTYIVRLTVTDDDSATGGATRFIVVQPGPGGTFGNFTEVTPVDSVFVTPQDEDFWVIATAPADFDGDGDLDVAVLGYYVVYNQSVEDRLLLITNNGPDGSGRWGFTYTNVPLGALTTGASDLAWGDVDGDGDPDLVVGTDGATVLFRNNAGVLVLTDTNLPGYDEYNNQADFDLRSITWVDYDNDGDLDLFLPSVFDRGTFSYRTALMRNMGPNGTGGWTFTETDSVFAPTWHAQSSWADFDGDQDLDLLLVNIAPLTDEGFIRRYRNDGGGVFTGQDLLGGLTVEHGEAQWGDYDADGDLDILVAGNLKDANGLYTEAIRIYRNTNDQYDSLEVIPCVPCRGWFDLTAATWADYDNDGDMDILLAGTYNSGSNIEGRAQVLLNDGGVFPDSGAILPAPRASGSRGGTFSWLDIDGEGDLDYFIAGQYFVPGGNGLVEAQMHVYRNDAAGSNAPPSAPPGLIATVQDSGRVLFSWAPADDDHTPRAALTYELALYRNGVPVGSQRRLPQPGNVSAGTGWLLSGLQDGQYSWTLQAVDAGYNGGTASVGSFEVGGGTPVEPDDGLPQSFVFEKNYPDPFNPGTTFRFALPERARVELVVHNLVGQQVARILDEVCAPGVHEVRWDAYNLASGVYLVRFAAGAFTSTRKVTLLK